MSQCRACKAEIVFARGSSGKMIPLQRIRSLYAIDDGAEGPLARKLTLADEAGIFVSHFETCTDPNRFSKAK